VVFKLQFCHKMKRSGMAKLQLKNHPLDNFVKLVLVLFF
jgi:hypothetical protein